MDSNDTHKAHIALDADEVQYFRATYNRHGGMQHVMERLFSALVREMQRRELTWHESDAVDRMLEEVSFKK